MRYVIIIKNSEWYFDIYWLLARLTASSRIHELPLTSNLFWSKFSIWELTPMTHVSYSKTAIKWNIYQYIISNCLCNSSISWFSSLHVSGVITGFLVNLKYFSSWCWYYQYFKSFRASDFIFYTKSNANFLIYGFESQIMSDDLAISLLVEI